MTIEYDAVVTAMVSDVVVAAAGNVGPGIVSRDGRLSKTVVTDTPQSHSRLSAACRPEVFVNAFQCPHPKADWRQN